MTDETYGPCGICGEPSELIVHIRIYNEIVPVKMCSQCFFAIVGKGEEE